MSYPTDRVVDMMVVQALHYPPGHGFDWGKDIDGDWVDDFTLVGEYG